MRSIGEILTWGVPEFLPPELTDMEIWEFNVPQQAVAGFTVLNITRDSATGPPVFQLAPGSDVSLHIQSFARNHLRSTLSELETRITDVFGSGRSLAYASQNFNDCTAPGAELINRVNIWTAPQASQLLTQYTIDFDGSGTLCSGPSRRCGLSVRIFVNSGSIVKANPTNLMGTVWTPQRIN